MLNFAFIPMTANAFPYMFNLVLVTSPIDYAMIGVAISVGTFIGAIVIGNLSRKIKVMRSTFIGLVLLIASYTFITYIFYMILNDRMIYSKFYMYALGIMFIQGLILMYVNIPLNTAFARFVDEKYRGRAFAVVGSLSMAATPLAMLLGGIVIEFAGVLELIYGCLGILLMIMVYMFGNKNIRIFFKQLDMDEKSNPDSL